MNTESLLQLKNLEVRYSGITAIKGVDLTLGKGELVAVIGSNGAGKSTMLKTISGLLSPFSGEIQFAGKLINGLAPHKVTALGIAHCPEGRKVFATQSVQDNLLLGGFLRRWKDGRKMIMADMENCFAIFPILRERREQLAGTLSGGQQQMLAIARALMSKPKLLLLDEPSMGLAPVVIDEVFKVIRDLHASGEVAVLLIEQLAYRALQVADRAYVLEQGVVKLSGSGAELLNRPEVRQAYLGVQKKPI